MHIMEHGRGEGQECSSCLNHLHFYAAACNTVRLVCKQAQTTLKNTTCASRNVTYWPNLFFLWKLTHDVIHHFHPNRFFCNIWWLGLMTLDVFSNLNDCMILWLKEILFHHMPQVPPFCQCSATLACQHVCPSLPRDYLQEIFTCSNANSFPVLFTPIVFSSWWGRSWNNTFVCNSNVMTQCHKAPLAWLSLHGPRKIAWDLKLLLLNRRMGMYFLRLLVQLRHTKCVTMELSSSHSKRIHNNLDF